MGMRSVEYGGHPLTIERKCGAKTLRHTGRIELIFECGGVVPAISADPLHFPTDAGEMNWSYYALVTQCVAVAVFEVGMRFLVGVVMDERNSAGVRPERRTRQTQSSACAIEGLGDAITPRAFVTRMMNLIE